MASSALLPEPAFAILAPQNGPVKRSNDSLACQDQQDNEKKDEDEDLPVPQPIDDSYYPFAFVLRLRVLQIVCGISLTVMGVVALIEQRGEFSLALGIPAGAATVIAAAMSIHTSRGFEGYKVSTCRTGSRLRFLGPSTRVALPLCLLWSCACALQTALLAHALRVLVLGAPGYGLDGDDATDGEVLQWKGVEIIKDDVVVDEDMGDGGKEDLTVLAIIQIILTTITLVAVFLLVRIDCKYDPD